MCGVQPKQHLLPRTHKSWGHPMCSSTTFVASIHPRDTSGSVLPSKRCPPFFRKRSTSHRSLSCWPADWLPEPSPTTNYRGQALSSSLMVGLGSGAPTGIPTAGKSYIPTASGATGTVGNRVGGGGGGGICSASEVVARVSAAAGLFSILAIATASPGLYPPVGTSPPGTSAAGPVAPASSQPGGPQVAPAEA